MDIAARLKQIRGKLSQDEFSELVRVHKNSIGRYERGDSTPDMVFAQSVCTIFGVCPEWLIFGTGPMRPGEAAPIAPDCAPTPQPAPETPVAAQENISIGCAELKRELEMERRERRELTAEVRHLWKENGELREKCARLEERQYQRSISHDGGEAVG